MTKRSSASVMLLPWPKQRRIDIVAPDQVRLEVEEEKIRGDQWADKPGILASLSSLAGLEAWWLTAEMAKAASVEAWWTLAERRAARLAQAAGPHGDTLLRYAGTRLERMRTSSRND